MGKFHISRKGLIAPCRAKKKCPLGVTFFSKEEAATQLKLEKKSAEVAEKLIDSGNEAYFVGGYVRDSLMGVPCHDIDISTNAKPEEVVELFDSTIPTGLKHGTVTVMVEGDGFEVTTYRVDGDYSDGRRPDSVSFSSSLVEDLERRDFTINAMAMDKDGNIVDPFNGKRDMEEGVIRAVGDPYKRFKEDPLRMLRAIRFSGKMGFSVEQETMAAIQDLSSSIHGVSKERITEELTKTLTSSHPEKGLENLRESGLLRELFPEMEKTVGFEQHNPHHDKDVYGHTIDVVKNSPEDKVVRWAAFLHGYQNLY